MRAAVNITHSLFFTCNIFLLPVIQIIKPEITRAHAAPMISLKDPVLTRVH